jgi:carboxypeptidase C (cathepsin A)
MEPIRRNRPVPGKLRVAYYESGHMMYVRRADAAKFRRDYLQLLAEATAAP